MALLLMLGTKLQVSLEQFSAVYNSLEQLSPGLNGSKRPQTVFRGIVHKVEDKYDDESDSIIDQGDLERLQSSVAGRACPHPVVQLVKPLVIPRSWSRNHW